MPKALLIDETIKKIEYLYRCTGINVKAGVKTQMDTYRCRFVYILNFIWLNTDVAGAIAWFLVGLTQHKDFTELTYVAPCITLSILSDIKSLYMIMNEGTIDQLIDNLRKFEVEQSYREGNMETESVIRSENIYLNRVIQVLNIFYAVLIICFALSSLLLVLLKYIKTNEVELILPFLILYPFDPFDMRYYPWVYLRQIWSETIVVYGVCTADFMFYIFCTYLCIQFRLLGHYVEKVIPSESKNGNVLYKEEIKARFVELIKWHQELISSADLLESLYTRSTLFNFVSSSVLICLTGFNVMAIDDIFFILTFLCFLLMSLLQIFFLCFFGNRLMEASMGVGDAIYNSNWYLADPSLWKTLLIIQTRAQRPCKLTASNFAEVNLRAFMKICSTAWSYFALLQTMYTGPSQ